MVHLENNLTALIEACRFGWVREASVLLELGADPSLESKDGFTALDFAASYEVLSLLRKAA